MHKEVIKGRNSNKFACVASVKLLLKTQFTFSVVTNQISCNTLKKEHYFTNILILLDIHEDLCRDDMDMNPTNFQEG